MPLVVEYLLRNYDFILFPKTWIYLTEVLYRLTCNAIELQYLQYGSIEDTKLFVDYESHFLFHLDDNKLGLKKINTPFNPQEYISIPIIHSHEILDLPIYNISEE